MLLHDPAQRPEASDVVEVDFVQRVMDEVADAAEESAGDAGGGGGGFKRKRNNTSGSSVASLVAPQPPTERDDH